jgi:hypothetical protein
MRAHPRRSLRRVLAAASGALPSLALDRRAEGDSRKSVSADEARRPMRTPAAANLSCAAITFVAVRALNKVFSLPPVEGSFAATFLRRTPWSRSVSLILFCRASIFPLLTRLRPLQGQYPTPILLGTPVMTANVCPVLNVSSGCLGVNCKRRHAAEANTCREPSCPPPSHLTSSSTHVQN